MVNELVFCAKYPFSEQAKKILEKINVLELSDGQIEKALSRVNNSIKGANPVREFEKISLLTQEGLMAEIASFPIAKLIVACSNDFFAKRKFAEAEAEKVYYFLQMDYLKQEDDARKEELLSIARQFFRVREEGNRIGIPFNEYLKNKPDSKDFKLTLQELNKGIVWIDNLRSISLLISTAVKNSILEMRKPKNVPEKVMKAAERIEKAEKFVQEDFGSVDEQFFPPCIKSIIRELLSGEKVSHYPRFVLATFFANINMSVNKAVDYFKSQPNFDEKKTIYYLEHALGKRGGTKYSVPSCSKMESYGLCKKDYTCKWKHPLTYYKNMKRGFYERKS